MPGTKSKVLGKRERDKSGLKGDRERGRGETEREVLGLCGSGNGLAHKNSRGCDAIRLCAQAQTNLIIMVLLP